MKSPRSSHVIRAAALWVALAAAALAQTPAPGGIRVISLTGTLTVRDSQRKVRALRVNDSVELGDELTAGENSEAVIRTAGGATVRIYPDSRVMLSPQPSAVQDFLHLFLGSVKVHIEKFSGRPNPHQMSTPTAIIAVRGTTFSVLVDETGSTMVAVDEGVVAVANVRAPSREVILHRGQRTVVRPGQPPTQARRFRGASERADMMPDNGAGAMAGSGMDTGAHGSMGQMGAGSHGMTGRGGHR